MIKIGTVNGDVIEAGGVKNVTNNYYQNENENENGNRDITVRDSQEVPPILLSQKATELMGRLVAEGLIDEAWQPVGLSLAERAEVAMQLAQRINLREVWLAFGCLWQMKPETLRSAFNKGREQKKMLTFQDRLKKVLG